MGAHPIKVGLSPIIINLIEKNIIDAVCLNGACIIHDFELSYLGQTSEDVAVELTKGTFGMAEETGKILNKAINEGVSDGLGLGESIGKLISNSSYPYKNYSIIANGYNKQIPVTVHVAVGTDIIHMHPEADGKKIGQGSHKDFRLMASVVANLDSGVYINLGSSVILPEVFLKALNIARNLGYKVENLTTVNMDFIQHYRPRENVLKRPTINTGRGYALVGHHEIMFPLLAASILNKLEVKT
jgi:deoxyhypusine synthase